MLHILLLILKIIGILLGTLLAVVLICLALALFVPVRYRIEASRTEEEGAPPIEAEAKITWLLHLVNIRIQYPADVYFRARIFLFTVFRLPQKQKKEGSKKGRRKKGKKNERENIQKAENRLNAESTENVMPAQNEAHTESVGSAEDTALTSSPEPEAVQEPEAVPESKAVQEPEPEKKKIPFKERIKEKIILIRRIFQKIWYTLTGICDKIKAIWENIEYYMGILQSDTFKQAFSLCKGELFSILSYVRPRKFQADLTIGMDDPAATGKIFSYYGILYPFIGSHVAVRPDFERKRIEGTVFIRGKIRLFTFIKAAFRIYFSKDIRKLLKLFKKEDL